MRLSQLLSTALTFILFTGAVGAAQVVTTESVPGKVLQSFAPAGSDPKAWAFDDQRGIVYVAAAKQVTGVDAISGMVKSAYTGFCGNGAYDWIVGLEVRTDQLLVICRYISGYGGSIVDLTTGASDTVAFGPNIAVSPSGKSTAAINANSNSYLQIRPESTNQIYSINQNVQPYSDNGIEQKLLFNPSGSTLAFIATDYSLQLIDVSSGNSIAKLESSKENLRTVRFSADGQSLILLTNQRIRVLRLGTLAVQYERAITGIEGSLLIGFQLAADTSTLMLSTRKTYLGGQTRTLLFDLNSSSTPPREFNIQAIGVSADGHYLVTMENGLFEVRGSETQNLFLKSRVDLLVNVSTANVSVSVGGQALSVATDGSYSAALYPGSYDLLVSSPGYRPYRRTLKIASGAPVSLNVALEVMRGSVRFESVPSGASINLNGQVRGVTPLTVSDLPLGALEYTLQLPDHRETKGRVTIADETPLSVRETLAELPGLNITSVPGGASIAIDGRTVGVTPLAVTNLSPGRVSFTATLAGYAAFSGRALVPENGKGTVEIVLNRSSALTLPARPEAVQLRFEPTALEQARRDLILVNNVPMLSLNSLAQLTGLGIYGDAVLVTLASGSKEVKLSVGEPTRARPTLYALNSALYAPLTALEPFGLRLIAATSVVMAFSDDRVDLGVPRQRIFTEAVVAPIRAPWRTALERAIILDGAPAFAVRDLIGIVRGVAYLPETLTLTFNCKPLLRAFVAPKGYAASLVIFRGSAYLPSALLPMLGITSSYKAELLELGSSGVDFSLRFATPGRAVASTRTIANEREIARRQAEAERVAAERRAAQEIARFRQRINATRTALESATGLSMLYLGGDRWGNVQTRYDAGVPYSVVTMYSARTSARSGWTRCTWISNDYVVSRDVAGGGGLIFIAFDTLGRRVVGSFAFNAGGCQLVSTN